jgi:hypothetical protein
MTTSSTESFEKKISNLLISSSLTLALGHSVRLGSKYIISIIICIKDKFIFQRCFFHHLLTVFKQMQNKDFQSLQTISNETKLNKRVLQELLSVLVCGDIIEAKYNNNSNDDDSNFKSTTQPNADDLLFRLEDDKAKVLLSFGIYTQEIPLLTSCAFEKVENSFKTGDGVGYDDYQPFVSFMGDLSVCD